MHGRQAEESMSCSGDFDSKEHQRLQYGAPKTRRKSVTTMPHIAKIVIGCSLPHTMTRGDTSDPIQEFAAKEMRADSKNW